MFISIFQSRVNDQLGSFCVQVHFTVLLMYFYLSILIWDPDPSADGRDDMPNDILFFSLLSSDFTPSPYLRPGTPPFQGGEKNALNLISLLTLGFWLLTFYFLLSSLLPFKSAIHFPVVLTFPPKGNFGTEFGTLSVGIFFISIFLNF